MEAIAHFAAVNGSKKALVILADRAEDVEVTIILYVFRLSGISTIVASIGSKDPVTCFQGLKIVPDTTLEEARAKGPYDIILLPGGFGGGKVLSENKLVGEVLKEQEEAGRLVGAVCCGAGWGLTGQGIYKGRRLTTYPHEMVWQVAEKNNSHQIVKDEIVTVDGPLITGVGVAATFPFAFEAVKAVCGSETEQFLRKYLFWDNKGNKF